MTDPNDPHANQPVRHMGAPIASARLAMVLLHGRGAGAQDILGLSQHFYRPEVAYLAPEAAGRTWYPNSFLVPTERNEPYLSSALRAVDGLVGYLGENGLGSEHIVLLGFSQGACLTCEYAARHARRFGGLFALTGGLIGETPSLDLYRAELAGTPAFLGCSDVDPHIPLARLRESSRILSSLGAEVSERIYPGMGHSVNEDEIGRVNALLDGLLAK